MKISDFNLIDNLLCTYGEDILAILLKDRTTKKNIVWATDEYEELGPSYAPEREIKVSDITGFRSGVIKPRIVKATAKQQERTQKRAEVFTPTWIVNKMVNLQDEAWFGYSNVFNTEGEHIWVTRQEPIKLPSVKGKTPAWQKYVDMRKLEITCGEAPFITSRYDATTGEMIPLKSRIGMLDRKLRIVTENAKSEKEWIAWAFRAMESTYGYEFSGDNLLIARINVFFAFEEQLRAMWDRSLTEDEARKAARIVSWNIWQMDGMTGTIPFGKSPEPRDEWHQMTIYDWFGMEEPEKSTSKDILCRIYDWRTKEPVTYASLKQ